jgi:nitronate monooxygenase
MREHENEAPHAYPAVHHVTSPIRAHARAAGDPELLNLWAGQAHELITDEPAAEVVRRLHEETVNAIDRLTRRINRG